jgi:phage tail-like protein
MSADDQVMRRLTNAAFRFVVELAGKPQAAFTECTLPTLEWEVEEVKEGGMNQYTHSLPGRRKSARITLKNGVGKSMLLEWYIQALSKQTERKQITIRLLDNTSIKTVMVWNIENAYPIKWTGPQLKSSDSSIAIQTLELVCGNITFSTG